jgi:diguanylate cyclase (GGDEF)-like protein
VLLADLDHFKWANDRFGHAVGDRVLRLFADTAVACLRPDDLVGRLGGEGVVAILSGAGAEGAVAERVRAAFVAVAAEIDVMPVGGSVSIGIASARAGDCELDQLLAQADGPLYLAKARGRNRVENAGDGRTSAAPAPAAGTRRGGKSVLTLVDLREAPLTVEGPPAAPVPTSLTY